MSSREAGQRAGEATDQPASEQAAGEQSLGPREGRRVIARLADELVPVLIARLEESALGELEVREDGWRVRLRRPLQRNGAAPSDETLIAARPGERAPAGEGRPAPPRQDSRTQVTAPAVGYFIPRDGLSVGMSLRNGDVIGHIDVLGVQQEVVVPVDAILARLEAEAGQAVEYGQPIARLEPEARG